jgi:signal transduction histidine kinase
MTAPTLHACLDRYPGAALELDGAGVVLASNGHLDTLVGRPVVGVAFGELVDSSSQARWRRILAAEERANLARAWELVIATPTSLELRTFLAVWGAGPAADRLWLLEQSFDPKLELLSGELSSLNRELVEAQRTLGRERDRLRRAVDRAEAAVRTRDDVLAVVSHDLRNPLNRVVMASDLLELPLSEERKAEQIQVIRRAAKAMDRLISDLLDVSAIEAGRLTVELEPLALGSLIEEGRRMFDEQAARMKQRLDCEISGTLPPVRGDRHRLLQVLSNLVGNAVKFTPEGGAIGLHAKAAADEVVVTVQDTGPGIPERDLPHIFDRFWHAGRQRRGGAGLGLAIVKGVLEAHRGRVWAESVPGRGATFAFALPIARGQSETPAPAGGG